MPDNDIWFDGKPGSRQPHQANWYIEDHSSMLTHMQQLDYWLSRVALSLNGKYSDQMVNNLAMAHFHASKANELKTKLDKWMPGGHTMR